MIENYINLYLAKDNVHAIDIKVNPKEMDDYFLNLCNECFDKQIEIKHNNEVIQAKCIGLRKDRFYSEFDKIILHFTKEI